MKAHFEMMAAYNAWANRRLYDAAGALEDADYRRDLGAACGSIHNTLNHIYVADMIWMARFRGMGNPPWTLDHVPHAWLPELRARRRSMDLDIQGFVRALTPERLTETVSFRSLVMPDLVHQTLADALAHFFNHQTHHRGQCHALLTRLTGEAPPLDLLLFQRGH